MHGNDLRQVINKQHSVVNERLFFLKELVNLQILSPGPHSTLKTSEQNLGNKNACSYWIQRE